MREETIHYLVDLLKRTPSHDARHVPALNEFRDISDKLIGAKSPRINFPIIPILSVTDIERRRPPGE
jgi:hypothetical protein